jgi:hypothetical protein
MTTSRTAAPTITHAHNIIAGAKRVAQYAQLMLKDIDPATAAAKPSGRANVIIDTNTPTFVFGHLAIYPARVLSLLGRPDAEISAIKVSEQWENFFKAGAPCEDDANNSLYPSLALLSQHFFHAHDQAMRALEHPGTDARLLEPFPDPARREVFPLVGAAINFLMVGHPMVHLGQVSTWRRCMGLKSAMG